MDYLFQNNYNIPMDYCITLSLHKLVDTANANPTLHSITLLYYPTLIYTLLYKYTIVSLAQNAME